MKCFSIPGLEKRLRPADAGPIFLLFGPDDVPTRRSQVSTDAIRRLHQLRIAGENLLVAKVCGFDQPYSRRSERQR
jgi:hypothetical protein